MSKSEFHNIAKKILRAKDKLRNPQIMHPAREWVIGLTVSLIVFIISVAWNFHTYQTYRNPVPEIDQAAATDVVVYREAMVADALARYEEVQAAHEALLSDSVRVGGSELTQPTTENETPTGTASSSDTSPATSADSTPKPTAGDTTADNLELN